MNSSPPQRELQLLIVDDNPLVAAFIASSLRSAAIPFRYRLVDSATDMSAALEGTSWDVVISDYRMPGFTGLDALRLLRSRDTRTPFILLTGHAASGLSEAVDKQSGHACLDRLDIVKLPGLLAQLLT